MNGCYFIFNGWVSVCDNFKLIKIEICLGEFEIEFVKKFRFFIFVRVYFVIVRFRNVSCVVDWWRGFGWFFKIYLKNNF